jgi:hypothetical protein
VEADTNFNAWFKHFEPTNFSFLESTSCRWDSSKGIEYFKLKAFENVLI